MKRDPIYIIAYVMAIAILIGSLAALGLGMAEVRTAQVMEVVIEQSRTPLAGFEFDCSREFPQAGVEETLEVFFFVHKRSGMKIEIPAYTPEEKGRLRGLIQNSKKDLF